MFGFDLDPLRFIGVVLGFVIGTTIHEFMHAYSALVLGDTTAQRQGRITLNPAAHFDPLGFFMMILLALGIGFLAWGRPVPVNPYALRFGRRGMAIVAFAGPLSNLALVLALTPVYIFGSDVLPFELWSVIGSMIYVNILLFSFNLIPIPPLDGFNILVGILPNYWSLILEPIRQYSIPILLGLVFLVPYFGANILRIPLNPLGEAVRPVFLGIVNLLSLESIFTTFF
jgi:Zn-dependent protease